MLQNKHIKKIDSIDRKILSLLEENGRASFVEIAKTVGLSQTPCSERIKRLEREGFIESYTARLNPKLVDRGFITFIQVTFTDSTNKTFTEFTKHIEGIPEILECHMVAGLFDCLLKVCVSDISEFRSVLLEKIAEIPDISQTNSFTVIEVLKKPGKLIA